MQDLIDKAQRTLVENRHLVQRMQTSTGIPANDEDDTAFTNFKQVILIVLCVDITTMIVFFIYKSGGEKIIRSSGHMYMCVCVIHVSPFC